jgi:uncharacterized membrane protein YeaQ/YmgE (transglycosylase-associated protein family)
MTITSLIWFLLIGLLAGWLASIAMKSGRQGVLGYLIIGVVGALLGGWLFGLLGIGGGGLLGALLTAFVGAVALIALLRLIRRV